MKVYADLHLHSKYSRATSKKMWPDSIEEYARKKGLNLLGTGDITHPRYLSLLKETLEEDGTGILKTSEGFRYVLQGEISLIYKQDGATRRIHHLLLAPDFGTVGQINAWLDTKGRRDYDGRPIFGFTSTELVEAMMDISRDIMVIPAHIWTPHFSLFGSKSGFDSLEECFGDQAKHIHAVETGLSSDPAMNRRLSQLDGVTLVSNSDSHSPWPWRMGRECSVFRFDRTLTYDRLMNSMKRDDRRFLHTVEVDPAYGKYHWDGHRKCDVVMSPEDAERLGNRCPECGNGLTIGVEHRVHELADRPQSAYEDGDYTGFKTLMPLAELIAYAEGIKTLHSKTVSREYEKLLELGDEFTVALETPREELERVTSERVVELILKNRREEIEVKPGYDGVYGELVA